MDKKRVLVVGAHPDDADLLCGGLAAKMSKAGHAVKFVSCTNGATGHHEIGGIELARRRYNEAQSAAKVAGLIEYQVLDLHTGELEASIPNRKTIIRIIREFKPDVIITHRPNDYHPDHRATALLVQDASYILSVPNMLPLTPALQKIPVIFFMFDTFKEPTRFQADVVIDIGDVIEEKVDMIHCHVSQVYEWLPYNQRFEGGVPSGDKERRAWLAPQIKVTRKSASTAIANAFRDRLIELYGPERGKKIEHAEAFELCEYGSQIELTVEEIAKLFPLDWTIFAFCKSYGSHSSKGGNLYIDLHWYLQVHCLGRLYLTQRGQEAMVQ